MFHVQEKQTAVQIAKFNGNNQCAELLQRHWRQKIRNTLFSIEKYENRGNTSQQWLLNDLLEIVNF